MEREGSYKDRATRIVSEIPVCWDPEWRAGLPGCPVGSTTGEKSASQRIQTVLMQMGAQFRETKGMRGCLQLGKSAQGGEQSSHSPAGSWEWEERSFGLRLE